MPAVIDQVRRMLGQGGSQGTRCLVCRQPVGRQEAQVRVHGGDTVHRRCASYSMRRPRQGGERLGYPRRS